MNNYTPRPALNVIDAAGRIIGSLPDTGANTIKVYGHDLSREKVKLAGNPWQEIDVWKIPDIRRMEEYQAVVNAVRKVK